MKGLILLSAIIYLLIGAIYVIANWKMVSESLKSREPSFKEGFIHGLAMFGAMICFPYYLIKSNKKK